MEIIKSEIQITLTKAQLLDLIQEALTTDAGPAIKRAITPMLQDAFPQFPDFTNISIGETDESGQTTVTLRQPAAPKAKAAAAPKASSDLKSLEPLEIAPQSEPELVDDIDSVL